MLGRGPRLGGYGIAGASHVDLYDKDPYVAEAVDELTTFYREKLGA